VLSRIYINTMEKQRQWVREDQTELARVAYFAAKPKMQAELTAIGKDKPNSQTKSMFATLGNTWTTCKPIWTKHGFSIDFFATDAPDDKIIVSCRLTHEAGHSEDFSHPAAPPDTKGPHGTVNKTIGQGIQSAITYAQTKVLQRALGVVPADDPEDNDGNDSPSDTGYQQRSRSAATHQEVRRGPVDPPPKRRPPPEVHRPLVVSLVQKLRQIQDDHEWSKAVQHACLAAPEREDLEEFAAYLEPSISNEGMPKDIRTEIRVAIAAGRKRFAEPPFDFPVLDPAGETDGEVFTDPFAWAREFMAFWDAATFADQANLLHHNGDALAAARTDAMAAKMLAQAHPPPDDAETTNETGSPVLFEAVRPPQGRGGPSWQAWVGLLLDELNTLPEPETDLVPWTEAQRPVIAEAPIVQRTEVVKLLIAAFSKISRMPLPWFAKLLVPTDKIEADEAWLADRLADLEKLPDTTEGRKRFDGLVTAMRAEMKRLQLANPAVYARVRTAYEAKYKLFPAEAAA